MIDLSNVEIGTEATIELCTTMAKYGKGTCFLGFSRGKDSVAAWLWLRRFFNRIIPFHVASVPHLQISDRSLDYYERFFHTKIERFMDGTVLRDFFTLRYQSPANADEIQQMKFYQFDKAELTDYLRKKYDCEDAWTAYAINGSDSIFRRETCRSCNGRRIVSHSFYPLWDWTKWQIYKIIDDSGVKLAPDYMFSKRSVVGTPTQIAIANGIKERYPEDFRRTKTMFPLCEVAVARNEFRRKNGKPKQEEENHESSENGVY